MTEKGGPTTQSGIFYQNSIVARHLADLLDLNTLPPRDRVLEVRVEAPSDVDDIVVRYADGHQDWIQTKERLRSSGGVWTGLWKDLLAQAYKSEFGADDRLLVILGNADHTSTTLRDLCDRAATSVDRAEFLSRLGRKTERFFVSVESVLGPSADALELLRRMVVEITPLEEVERAFERRRLATNFAFPAQLFSVLRDVAGGGGRRRALFMAAPLRRRLANEFGIEVTEPPEWGVPAYRATVQRLARIEIPGAGTSGPVSELFVWPRSRNKDLETRSDFEDELPSWDAGRDASTVDLQRFPSNSLDRCIVVAGPGYGKSALLTAIAARLTNGPLIPVLVPLASFSAADVNVGEFLNTHVNRDFEVRIDWSRLAEQGLVVLLFDGLDEIPTSRRQATLGRIATYSARYPSVPWMLTVRDASIISNSIDANIVEILPLENNDIVRFADILKGRVPELDGWEFTQHLAAYPDLARFARIPLFLTMLMSGWKAGEPLPHKRSDLIESYLKTLFDPHEHKSVPQSVNAGNSNLRMIAEALAFTSLERQEIGTTERAAHDLIRRFSQDTNEADILLGQLLSRGILQRQSAIRLQFPYPIVQEYLAACNLIKERPDSIAGRIDDAVQRPWAQVMQFAIELHPIASPIVRAILARDDDAFATGLRLVGRCITNGARVDRDVWEEVASRLAGYWESASSKIRERVGRLIADGFSQPLLPDVRARLNLPWLIEDGAGEIVTTANDPELTREVIEKLLTRKLDRFAMFRSLQPALDRIADEVIGLYAAKARHSDTTADELEGLANLLGDLDPDRLTSGVNLDLAHDDSLPDNLRLAAYQVVVGSLDDGVWPIVDRALRSGRYRDHWSAVRVIAKSDDPGSIVLDYLRNTNLSEDQKIEILNSLKFIYPIRESRIEFIQRCIGENLLIEPYHDLMLAYAARYGDQQAFENLLQRLPLLNDKLAGVTVSLLGHYPTRALGIKAADLVKERALDADGVTAMARSAVTGMTYIYEMDWIDAGGLKPCSPHPAIDAWAELVEVWTERDELTLLQRAQLLVSASELGVSRAVDQLATIVAAVTDPDGPQFDDDEHGHILRNAIDFVRQRRRLIPLDIAIGFARSKRANVPYAGIAALAAHANRSALDLLLQVHNDLEDWHYRGTALEAIETLAGRLGVTIRMQKGRLIAS